MTASNKPVALVTGSSRGIGRGIAERLARDGFHVWVNGIRPLEAGAGAVLSAIRAAGGTADFVQADVSQTSGRSAILAALEARGGRIDLLVNNAGIEPPGVPFLEFTEARFDHVIGTNLKGPFFLTQQVAALMIRNLARGAIPKGRICFITSIQGYVVTRGAEYCMSKAALGMAAKVFANGLGAHDIPVIEISPGVIHSDMADKHQAAIDRKIEAGRLITARWGEPDDVARLVAAFARGDLDYSTGSRIEVGGGLGLPRWY